MSDLIARMRHLCGDPAGFRWEWQHTMDEAMDEITRLRRRVSKTAKERDRAIVMLTNLVDHLRREMSGHENMMTCGEDIDLRYEAGGFVACSRALAVIGGFQGE